MQTTAIDPVGLEAARTEIELRERVERVAVEKMSAIIRIINELFETQPTVSEDFDPEDTTHRYLVFTVEVNKPTSEIIKLQKEWAKRMSEVGPGWMTAR